MRVSLLRWTGVKSATWKNERPDFVSLACMSATGLVVHIKLHEIVEADLTPVNVCAGEARREESVDDVVMKVASGA